MRQHTLRLHLTKRRLLLAGLALALAIAVGSTAALRTRAVVVGTLAPCLQHRAPRCAVVQTAGLHSTLLIVTSRPVTMASGRRAYYMRIYLCGFLDLWGCRVQVQGLVIPQ